MAFGRPYVGPPGVEPMSPQQKRVRAGLPDEQVPHHTSEPLHVLIVLDDGNPLTMLVRGDAIEALQHLEILNGQAVIASVEV